MHDQASKVHALNNVVINTAKGCVNLPLGGRIPKQDKTKLVAL